MWDKCDSGKWSKDEVQAKNIGKHEDVMRLNADPTGVFYVPQSVKKLLSASRLLSKGSKMGPNQEKVIIKKKALAWY